MSNYQKLEISKELPEMVFKISPKYFKLSKEQKLETIKKINTWITQEIEELMRAEIEDKTK